MKDVAADLEDALGVLVQLAAGDYTARGVPSRTQEDFAALMLGVNMLAEELEASRSELEQRVTSRTAALAHLNQEILALSDLSNRLQRCVTTQEAIDVAAQGVSAILSGVSGALYVRADQADTLVRHTAWGPRAPTETLLDSIDFQGGWDHPATESAAAGLGAGARRLGAEGEMNVPLISHGQLFGMLRFCDDERSALADPVDGDAVVRLATAAAEFVALALANLDLREQLWTQAMRDPLTGLYNRRFMEEWAVGELSRTDRASESLGVMVVDLDRFKQVNDEHGHETGDQS